MKVLVLAACLGSLAIYAVASRFWFRVPGRIAKGMRLLEVCFLFGVILNTWYLLRVPIAAWRGWSALLGYISAVGIFTLACVGSRPKKLTMAFTPDVPGQLVENGIYRKIRHPFYAAYCLTWAAGFIATIRPELLLFTLWMMWLYWTAARTEESKFLKSPLAGQYRAYRQRAGMFWPRWHTFIDSEESKSPGAVWPRA